MAGYSFKEWARRNKETFKGAILFLGGYSYLQGFDWKVFLVGLGAFLVKLAVDAVDYWLKED
jgi:hypothetical protein